MAATAPSVLFPNPRLLPVTRVEFTPPEPAAPSPTDERINARREDFTPGELRVRIDVEAGRFIQTLNESNAKETLRRYPSEARLAFSRAITGA